MLFVYSISVFVMTTIGLLVPRTVSSERMLNTRDLGVALMNGMLVVYSGAMVVPKLSNLVAITMIVSLASLMRMWLLARKSGRQIFASKFDWQALAVAICLLTVVSCKIFGQPLVDWDARSIWFFQGKIIYNLGEVLDASIWGDPNLSWAHFDYPKLNAVFAALIAKALGGWNDTDPRMSIALIETPLFLLAASFSRSLSRKSLLAVIIACKAGTLMWDGRMDGILAAYIALGAIYAGRFLRDRDNGDLMVAIVASGVSATIKNEGIVLAGSLYFALIIGILLVARREVRALVQEFIPSVILVSIAIGSWTLWKHLHGVTNDLATGSPLSRLLTRATDGQSLEMIVGAINRPKEVRALVPFVLAIFVTSRFTSNGRDRAQWVAYMPALFVAVSYAATLVVVYLSTPSDLKWHLDTSAGRTVQPIFLSVMFVLAAFLKESDSSENTLQLSD